jgi:hypothetical protein|nr:MAG TPA: hypothetical protein [Herelleviridae sp.]
MIMSETTTKFELRTLKSEDVFPMFKIISKIGLKEIKEQFDPATLGKIANAFKAGNKDAKGEDMLYSIGFTVVLEIANIVIANVPNCKKEIYGLLSQVSGMSEKELANLDFVTFTEMIVEFFKKDEFKDFIGVVSKLFN